MSYDEVTTNISFVSAADFTDKQFLAVKMDDSGKAALCTGTVGEKSVGILQNEPAAADLPAAVCINGVSKCVTGGAVQFGDTLVPDANAKLVKGKSSVLGRALESAAAADTVIPVLLTHEGADDVVYSEISLTPAEILALNAAPKTLVPSPGAGYVLEFLSAVFILDYNTTAYATNGDITVHYTDGSGVAVSDTIALTDFLDETADTIRNCQVLSADTAMIANAPLVLNCATGNPTAGDSPVRVKVAYRIHATGL